MRKKALSSEYLTGQGGQSQGKADGGHQSRLLHSSLCLLVPIWHLGLFWILSKCSLWHQVCSRISSEYYGPACWESGWDAPRRECSGPVPAPLSSQISVGRSQAWGMVLCYWIEFLCCWSLSEGAQGLCSVQRPSQVPSSGMKGVEMVLKITVLVFTDNHPPPIRWLHLLFLPPPYSVVFALLCESWNSNSTTGLGVQHHILN